VWFKVGRNRKRRDRWHWGVQTPAQMRIRLKSLLDGMIVPPEVGVKKPNDLTWLQCHLRENNEGHPFVEQAVDLCMKLLREYRRNSTSTPKVGPEGPAYKKTFD